MAKYHVLVNEIQIKRVTVDAISTADAIQKAEDPKCWLYNAELIGTEWAVAEDPREYE